MEKITILNKLPDIIFLLRQNNNYDAYKMLNDILGELNSTILNFINLIPELSKQGIDVPAEVLTEQLKNLINGYENKDNALLADTLEYEITEALLMYQEIISEQGK